MFAVFALGASGQTLLDEGFEGSGSAQTAKLPDGWTTVKGYTGNNIDYNWSIAYSSKQEPMSGYNYAKVSAPMFNPTDGKGPREEWLVTPELKLDDTYQLSFWWYAAAASSLRDKEYELQVRVIDQSTNETTTIFSSSNEEQVRNSGVPKDPNGEYIWQSWTTLKSSLDLSSFKGKTIKVAFVYVMMKERANVLYLDNISVKQFTPDTGPVAQLVQSQFTFDDMYIGEKHYSETLELKNVGLSGLKVTGLEAPDGMGFVIDKDNINLSKNETAKFQVWYKAGMTTPTEGMMTIKTNGGDVHLTVKAKKMVIPENYTLELFEDFPPAGWKADNWSMTSQAIEGDRSAYSPGFIADTYLTTPRLDLSDPSKPHQLTFTYYSEFYSEDGDTYPYNDLSVWVSSDGGQTWNKKDSVWVHDYTVNNELTTVTLDLSKYTSNNTYVRWKNSKVPYDSESGAAEAATYIIDRVLLPCMYGQDGVPMATELLSPKDGASDVLNRNVLLKWRKAQFAEGYKVYVGKSASTFDVVKGVDVKDALEYTINLLDNSTTYYWKIVPYNGKGDAAEASVWKFSTQPDATVKNFPWKEGFESDVFPSTGWYAENVNYSKWSDNRTNPFDGKASACASARNSEEKPILYSPEVRLPEGKNMQISFWWGNDMCVSLKKDELNVRTNPTNGSNGIDACFFEINAGEGWKQLSMLSDPNKKDKYWIRERIDLTPYAGKTVMFRWRYEMYNYNRANGVSLDNVEVSDANAVNLSFSTAGWSAGKVNYGKASESSSITLSNFSGNDVSISKVAFSGDNFTTTLAPGETIKAGAAKAFTMKFDAKDTATGQDSVTVKDNLTISLSDGNSVSLPVVGIALAKDIHYYDFEKDATGVAPAGFTTVDADGGRTASPFYWNYPNIGTPLSFIVINDSQCNNSLKEPNGHQSLMSMMNTGSTAEDWIVSGLMMATDKSTFSFDARDGQSVNSILPTPPMKFGIFVSENDPSDVASFTQVVGDTQLDYYDNKAWKHYSFDLSDYAGKKIYVALKNFTSNGMWAFYDNFEFAHFDMDATSIHGIATDDLAGKDVTVYSLGGIKVADGKDALAKVGKGVYIVKSEGKAVKVVKQ